MITTPLIACLAVTAMVSGTAAASLGASAQTPLTPASVANGPAPPVDPDVMARDGEGRVTVRAVRIAAPLRLDGVLDDDVYRSVRPIDSFLQQEPRYGQPVSEPTRVWILFDREHLYVAAHCGDSQPDRIVGNDMRRDGRNVTQNDNLSVVLDTFYDRRNGYEFLVNAVGGMMDSQITDERDVNRDWNTVWVSHSRRDDKGWTVEIAIPFRSLRYRAGGAQVWGLNIRRTVKWKNEFAYLSLVPRTQGARGILKFSSAATLVGFEAPAASLNLDVKPYAVASVRADRSLDPSFKNELDPDAGVDVKYGLAKGLTADLTVRTDFAQVEDDDQQVNLTRFSQFFPEKREFFLEGQGIFAFGGVETGAARAGTSLIPGVTNTPLLFFSRRIGLSGNRAVPIDVGGRVTGKAGKYSIGVLDIQTSDAPEVGAQSTNFAVARVKRDILRRSYVGVIGTRRSPPTDAGGANDVLGLDASLSFFDHLNVVGYYARSWTPGKIGDAASHRARFDYDADLYALKVERLAVGRHFNPEVGFLRRSDFIEHLAQARISRRPAWWRAARKVSFEASLDYLTDGRRALQNRQERAVMRTDLQSSDSFSVEYERNLEVLPGRYEIQSGIVIPAGSYGFSLARAGYTFGTQRRVSGTVNVAHGGFYAGTRSDIAYRGLVDVSPQLSVEPGVAINRVALPEGRFTAKVLSARSTFAFSPRMFVGALLQYNSTSSTFGTNIRFRWEYHPGSDLFLVYTDGRDTLDRPSPGLLNRSVAVKLTRLLRF